MNIKSRNWLRTAIVFGCLTICAQLNWAAPGAVNDLSTQSGFTYGTIRLNWTSPSPAATAYELRYSQVGPINDSNWNNSSTFRYSPTLPPPRPAGTAETATVSGLQGGITYWFAIRSFDSNGISPISNTPSATASIGCTSFGDGKGTIQSIIPASVPMGKVTMTTTVFVVDSAGIGPGGQIVLRVPDSWSWPVTGYSSFDGYNSGYVNYSVTGGSPPVIAMSVDGPRIILTVQSGMLIGGDVVKIYYAPWVGCDPEPKYYTVSVKGESCGTLKQVGQSPLSVISGGVRTFTFGSSGGGTLTALLNSPTLVTVVAKDYCWNTVTTTAATPIGIYAERYDTTTFMDIADDTADLSLTEAFSSSFKSGTVVIPENSSNATFYYRINSDAYKGNNRIGITYTDPEYGYFNSNIFYVNPIQSGVTNKTVYTSQFVAGSTQVTITPDQDSINDFASIQFQLPDYMSDWRVYYSSNDFATFVRQDGGWWARDVHLTWDGSMNSNTGYRVVPPGIYKIKIAVGASITDTSMSIVVETKGVKGRVLSSGTPVSNIEVVLFGQNTWHNVFTDAQGRFEIYGVKNGSYQLEVRGIGYSRLFRTIDVMGDVLDVGDLPVNAESIARIQLIRPASVYAPDIYGSIEANTTDYSRFSFANVHFAAGSAASDSGYSGYNVTPTTYSPLTLAPNLAYKVRINIPGYGADPFLITLNTNESKDYTVQITTRPSIYGSVTLPYNSYSSQQHISVSAGLDNNSDGRYDGDLLPGGCDVFPGVLTCDYRIFGVSSGRYILRAEAPGFVPSTATIIIANGADANYNFPTFSEGGTISGTIQIIGSSNHLDSQDGNSDGYYRMHINANAPTSTFGGGWTQIQIPVNNTSTSASYSIKGVQNGFYEVHAWVPGFDPGSFGPKIVNVTNGAATADFTFREYTGQIVGTITLPPGETDFETVEIELLTYCYGCGEPPSADIDGNTYVISGLGTNYYRLRAKYPKTGLTVERSVQVANGQSTTIDIDLSANTYSISGAVTSLAGGVYSSLSYLVHNTTASVYSTVDGSTWIAANHIKLINLNTQEFNYETMSSSIPFLDTKNTLFGFYSSSGAYTIPNVSPGVYRIINNGEMDGNRANGRELAEIGTVVRVTNANIVNQNFTFTDGYNVSGTLRLANTANIAENPNVEVVLLNASHDKIASASISEFSQSGTANFNLYKIPSGNYVLTAIDNGSPKKYSAKELSITIEKADITGKEIRLYDAAKIQGKIIVAGNILTSTNYSQYLPENFNIYAQANPWFQGGWHSAVYPKINSDGYFTIYANPGTYDVGLKSEGFVGQEALAKGQAQYIPVILGGIKVDVGQTKNLGVIELRPGATISGRVVEKGTLTPLSNILVRVERTEGNDHDSLEATTDADGRYTIYGIDTEKIIYYDVIAAPRPSAHDDRFQFGFNGIRYAQVIVSPVNTQETTTVNFELEPANGAVTGRIITPDNGALRVPFDDDEYELPGAFVIMNKQRDIPQNNPLGNIEEQTDADGFFTVKGLAPGTYDLWALSRGYGSAVRKNIVVQANATTDIGIATMTAGSTLSGKLYKTDGTTPSDSEVGDLLAIRNGFDEILIGELTVDAAGSILGYSIAGMRPHLDYSLLIFDDDDSMTLLQSSVTISVDTRRDFIIQDQAPDVFSQASRGPGNIVSIQFDLTKPLRNSDTDIEGDDILDDNDPEKILVVNGAGTLSAGTAWISTDRRRLNVTYTPAAGETSFSITFNGTFNAVNVSSGTNFSISKTFTYYLGIAKQKTTQLTNANGGTVTLENDPSKFAAQPGTFGSATDLVVNVTFRAAQTASSFAGAAPLTGSGVLEVADAIGIAAYPPEMAAAIQKAKAVDINPLSSFYDVVLPLGVSHFFPEGREAQLCLTYDATVSDPYALNIYYYNSTSNEYLLENENKAVDTVNRRICANIAHASVFTVLASSAPLISGDGYNGELSVMNFPNPFDLKQKTVTLRDSASSPQTITGTMIKFSVPTTISGEVKIDIFSILGDKVRTLRTNVTGGAHFYMEWDGKNDAGQNVASGVYIARFTIADSNEKFFKMAVIK